MSNGNDGAGIRRLWAAVIVQAVHDLDLHNERKMAARWLFSESCGQGSFQWICDCLDLDARKIQSMCMTREGRANLLNRKRLREARIEAA